MQLWVRPQVHTTVFSRGREPRFANVDRLIIVYISYHIDFLKY